VGANLTKLVHGAWLPPLIAVTTFTIMITWQRGSTIVTRKREAAEGAAGGICRSMSRRRGLLRVPGAAVLLSCGNNASAVTHAGHAEHYGDAITMAASPTP
jgi:KUP system potassium uptake protein